MYKRQVKKMGGESMVKRFLGATKEFIKSMNERHVTAYAAQAAYFIILSFIPFMLVLMTSVKYTPLTKAEVVHALLQVLSLIHI